MDSWDYDFDNNENYQMDMLADEYKMVLRKAHKNISVFKGQVELVIKTKKTQKGAESNTQSVRATKLVPKRQLVFVPVTPTVQVKNTRVGAPGGQIEVGEGHDKTTLACAVPKSQKYEASENVKGCVGKAANPEFLAPFWCVTTVRPKEECNMEVMVNTIKFDGQDVNVPVMTNSVALKTGDVLKLSAYADNTLYPPLKKPKQMK